MAYRNVRRADPNRELVAFVPHTPLLGDRWTGVLHLVWHVPQASPVVIGAGRYELHQAGASTPPPIRYGPPRPVRRQAVVPPEVVARIVRRGETGPPVLPGSSLKGAVRQAFELLTPSCQPGTGGCKVGSKEAGDRIKVCRACSLFGAPGLGGRLALGEAVPAEGWPRRLLVRKVPVPWKPNIEVPGTMKFYDPERALTREQRPAREEEPTWTVWGDFFSRVRLVNASPEELGLLFAALGLGVAGLSVRLGGRKYHGFGAATVEVTAADQIHPDRRGHDRETVEAWIREHLDRWVLDVEARRQAWDDLHRVLQGS